MCYNVCVMQLFICLFNLILRNWIPKLLNSIAVEKSGLHDVETKESMQPIFPAETFPETNCLDVLYGEDVDTVILFALYYIRSKYGRVFKLIFHCARQNVAKQIPT